jgi:hypothetical protein
LLGGTCGLTQAEKIAALNGRAGGDREGWLKSVYCSHTVPE